MTTPLQITLPEPVLQQTEALAQQLALTPAELIALALENFLHYQHHPSIAPSQTQQRDINQGDLYWLQDHSADIPHPHVVVQDDLFNHSRIDTVIVCALTSNIQRTSYPGNVLLDAGEANLAKASVVEVAKISTVAKTQLGDYIGTLSAQRVAQILAGLRFVQRTYFER